MSVEVEPKAQVCIFFWKPSLTAHLGLGQNLPSTLAPRVKGKWVIGDRVNTFTFLAKIKVATFQSYTVTCERLINEKEKIILKRLTNENDERFRYNLDKLSWECHTRRCKLS